MTAVSSRDNVRYLIMSYNFHPSNWSIFLHPCTFGDRMINNRHCSVTTLQLFTISLWDQSSLPPRDGDLRREEMQSECSHSLSVLPANITGSSVNLVRTYQTTRRYFLEARHSLVQRCVWAIGTECRPASQCGGPGFISRSRRSANLKFVAAFVYRSRLGNKKNIIFFCIIVQFYLVFPAVA
jgi:hypothetical protein